MQTVIITGPKHSGKTCAGRELAKLLGCSFTDLDEEIARHTGKSPRELYAEGEEIFRKAEAEAVGREQGKGNKEQKFSVLAAGGGIIDNREAMVFFENNPSIIIIYLNVSAETAWERISREGELPPFIMNNGQDSEQFNIEQAREQHRILHERRAAAYRKIADIAIEANGKSAVEIAGKIMAYLKTIT